MSAKTRSGCKNFVHALLIAATVAQPCAALAIEPAHSSEPHELRLITQAAGGLAERLRMIDRARHSINIESYIFVADAAGRLLLQAIDRKAKQGVKVRILVDLIGQGIDPTLASVLAEDGVEVKFFRPGASWNIVNMFGHRSHRKSFVVDGREMIMGGRNSASRNMGMPNDKKYIFYDYELAIRGPLAHKVEASFEEYWASPLSKVLPPKKKPKEGPAWSSIHSKDPAERLKQAREFLTENDSDRAMRATVLDLGGRNIDALPAFESRSIWFVGDEPELKAASRKVTPFLHERLAKTEKSLIAEEWAFSPSPKKLKLLEKLATDNKRVEILSNGYIAALDPVYTRISHRKETEAVRKGIRVLDLKGGPAPGDILVDPSIASYRFGTHAKTFVIDGRNVFIGSYNFDNRSENINSECGIFVENQPELAEAVERTIRARMRNAWTLGPDGQYTDGPKFKETVPSKSKLKLAILGGLSELLSFLY